MKNSTVFIVIIMLAALLVSATFLFVPNNSVIMAYPGGVTALVIGGEVVDNTNPPVIQDEQTLIPVEVVKKYFDKTLYWDAKLQKIIITTSDKVIKIDINNKDASINNESVALKISAQMIAGTAYMPIDFLKDVYKIDIEYNKKKNIVIIDYRETIKKAAEVIVPEAPIRSEMSIKSPIFERTKKGDRLWAFDEYEKWYKVRSSSGTVGYIEKKHIKISALISSYYNEVSVKPVPETIENILDGKLNVVWNSIYSKTPNMSNVEKVEGLDVVAPTWFDVIDKNGAIKNKADSRYLEWAKEKGYKVWPVLTSMEPKITTEILNSSVLREKVINEVLTYAKQYKLDGINVDFENMYLKDKDMFSQFIRELAPRLRAEGLVVSVDIGVPGGSDNYSKCYDRKALADAVDYIMVMTYDQHWQSSTQSGSVAQLAWVEKKVKETLIDVPASKLLLGLPFYIREWRETTKPDGTVTAKQNAVLSMSTAQKRIRENKADVRWDEESGQFYAEYKKDNATYRLWLEDKNSINLKASLVHKYHLAGTAAWRLGLESEDVWVALDKTLKKDMNFIEWAKANSDNTYKFE